MRLFNEDTEKKVNNVILYLTHQEAREMKDSLETLLNDKDHHHNDWDHEQLKTNHFHR